MRVRNLKNSFSRSQRIKHFVIDVDGVLTDGGFYYDASGKVMKKFGPHDSDALKEIGRDFQLSFITADLRGFKISKRRIGDMGYKLIYVPCADRLVTISNYRKDGGVIFMADSFTDIPALDIATISICPANAMPEVKKVCTYISKASGGAGAVAEVALLLKSLQWEAKTTGLDKWRKAR